MHALREALWLIDLLEACQGWVKDGWVEISAFKIYCNILETWGQDITD